MSLIFCENDGFSSLVKNFLTEFNQNNLNQKLVFLIWNE